MHVPAGCATLFTLLSGFSSSFWVYLASRLLTGIGAAGQALVTWVMHAWGACAYCVRLLLACAQQYVVAWMGLGSSDSRLQDCLHGFPAVDAVNQPWTDIPFQNHLALPRLDQCIPYTGTC
jgi:hypothetical protein